ncbi:MAG: thiamine pyrophosphate-dependent enzyme, partial [Asticcacaulis sp.]
MADDSSRLNQVFAETSFLYGTNAIFIEQMQERWAENPNSVSAEWRAFFDSLRDQPANVTAKAGAGEWARPSYAPRDDMMSAMDGVWPAVQAKAEKGIAVRNPAATTQDLQAASRDSVRALMLIRTFRIRGHLQANLDPLGLQPPAHNPELDPAYWGFSDADIDRPIFLDGVLGMETATLREILVILRRTYCGNIGVQYMHIADPGEKAWVQERIEGRGKEITFTKEGKIAILKKLIETEGFERFCHRRFPGTKRFGLDGGEAMIPALEQMIKRGGALGVQDIIFGMAHRGRLNVLSGVMGKPYRAVFHEFQGGSTLPTDIEGSSDVKYHMGASSDRAFDGNKVHLSLTANPSHLEIVNPVVLGKTRAKQAFHLRNRPNITAELASDSGPDRSMAMGLLIHGDAAFAGQGVGMECLALMGLKGYRTGGTMHFIINNQIGFTTAPHYSRSSPYPSDVALMASAPILHCNGDDPESVVFAAKMATEFRQKFAKDVVVDMFCYRRFGHNEGDDPTFTQPIMYAKIKDHPSTRELYSQRLIEEGVITQSELDGFIAEFDAFLDEEFEAGKTYKATKADWLDGKWQGLG